ncbi:MAG: tRNA (adenosine(37)-N6)-dimethylallyltransferase MiaA [Nitrospirae bacterium]|nr:tRNA (adenosine(37)-N6)-dimethylallyltransferase MiaA [Nitrospirota bacterium]
MSSGKKPVIILTGPTSVGKSKIALYLARQLSADIISADSRQIYRGMDIGTAKPAMEEMKEIRHHMVDIVDPDERFSAGRYKDMVSSIISGMHEDGMMPFIVGGTGLYIKAVVYGLWEGPSADWDLRRRYRDMESSNGEGYLYGKLSLLDPESARSIHPKDIAKIIRAMEVFYKTGRPLASFHRSHSFSGNRYEPVIIGLRREREDLYRRIGRRTERMIEEGLIDEVRALLDKGYGEDLGAMKGLGYKQILDYLGGRCTIDEAIGLIKRDTRRYAKRQFTWFNRDRSIRWIDIDEGEAESVTFEKIMELLAGMVDIGYIKERSRR